MRFGRAAALVGALGAAVAGSAMGGVVESSEPEFDFELESSSVPDTKLSWRVEPDGSLTARVVTEGSRWIGLGLANPDLSSNMVGGVAIVGSSSPIRTVSFSNQMTSGVSEEDQSDAGEYTYSQSDGSSTLELSNVTAIGDRFLGLSASDSSDRIIFAVGADDSWPSTHVGGGGRAALSVAWADGGFAEDTTLDTVRLVHGGVMLLAFGLLMPFGTSLGMYKRAASFSMGNAVVSSSDSKMRQASLLVNPREAVLFKRHMWVQIVSGLLAIAGAAIIVAFKTTHMMDMHEMVGVAIVGLVLVQIALGVFRPNKFMRPRWWDALHRLMLPLVITLGGFGAIITGVLYKKELDGEPTEELGDLVALEWIATIVVVNLGIFLLAVAFVRTKLCT